MTLLRLTISRLEFQRVPTRLDIQKEIIGMMIRQFQDGCMDPERVSSIIQSSNTVGRVLSRCISFLAL